VSDDESQFIESLMKQIERASREQRDALDSKLIALNHRMLEADLHISDQIETMISRARLRQNDIVRQLEDLKAVVTRQPHLMHGDDDGVAAIAPRFAPPPLPSEQYADEIFGQMNGMRVQ